MREPVEIILLDGGGEYITSFRVKTTVRNSRCYEYVGPTAVCFVIRLGRGRHYITTPKNSLGCRVCAGALTWPCGPADTKGDWEVISSHWHVSNHSSVKWLLIVECWCTGEWAV